MNINFCQKSVELDPEFSIVYLTLGNLLLDMDDDNGAIEAFETFLSIDDSLESVDIREEVKIVLEGLKG